jgi:hypothetical protein
MAIQMAPLAPELLLLTVAGVLVALVAAAAVQLARRRLRSSARLGAAAGAVVLLYGVALAGAGIASRPALLAPGVAKCFDDWCAAMVGAREDRAAGVLLVDVRLENHGRGRAMRGSRPTAVVVAASGAELRPRNGGELMRLVQPGGSADVRLVFDLPASARPERFVLSEGGGPDVLVVGDENGPLHARTGWPLTG